MSLGKNLLTEDQIEQVIISMIRKGHVDLNDHFYDRIQDEAYSLGFIKEKPEFSTRTYIINNETFLKCVDKYWEYVIKEFIAPGYDEHNIIDLRAHVTDLGKNMVKEEINPYSEKHYVSTIKIKAAVLTDDEAEMYIIESVKCFNYYCYLGAMVLLGGFSERIFNNFLQKFIDSMSKNDTKEKFKKKIDGKFIAVRFQEFTKFIESDKDKLPKSIKNQLNTWLNSFFDYIRKVRNDIGHPTGYEVSREEILAMYLIFPQYLENLNILLKFFQENPIDI